MISDILRSGESETIEFKTSFGRESIETLVAFANTHGGTVLIGVKNNAAVCGVDIGKETLNQWLGQIKSATSPSIIPDLTPHSISGQTIVSIYVSEYPVKPVNTRGKYFKRMANSNQRLTLSEINEFYMQSLQVSWDAYALEKTSLDELDVLKIEKFIETVNECGRFNLDLEPLQALQKLKMVTADSPTWAALLLFSREPLRHHIHIGRFKTPVTIIDDRQITDTLFEAVEQAMKFILSHIKVSFEFDGALQRKERFAYPLTAIREALLNAVVHRDYKNSSDIQIKIFDDKLTFFNPGTLYGGLTIEELSTDTYPSQLRNKLIAEAFYLTRNIEKYGSGMLRIRKELQAYPELSFTIEEKGGGILVTFLSGEGVTEGVTEGVNSLYKCIQQNPGLRLPEYSKKLNIPKKTLERWIKELRKEQKIIFKGSPRKGGYYIHIPAHSLPLCSGHTFRPGKSPD
ncbi:MAG: putative DNA binding domain-containing protein [Desulfobacteraceae bacterium]|nr:putative DNA binding domain-containing protein [Desulfobacteraceae bacterium]